MNEWHEAEQRVERALQLSEAHRWQEALREIEAALVINGGNATWHAHHGYLLDELERHDEAVHAYRRSLDIEPGQLDVLMALGVALARVGRLTGALEVLNEASQIEPEFEPAYCHRIRVYAELGRHEQAEEMFYRAQDLDERCPHCFFHIAGSLAARGQLEKAIYCWRRVLELEPGYLGVNERIGQAHRTMGRHDEAREYLLAELREDPGNTDLLFSLAELAVEGGDLNAAAARLAQIIELEPEHLEAHLTLGKLLVEQGDAARALESFRHGRTIAGRLPMDCLVPAATALMQLGQIGQARQHLESVLATDPGQIEATLLLGNCLLTLEQRGEAAARYRRVLAMTADRPADHAARPVAHHNLAVCLCHDGAYEVALTHCLEAIRLKPDYALAMRRAAVAYLHLARWSQARNMLQRAHKHDPDDATVGQLVGRIWRFRVHRAVSRLLRPWKWLSRPRCDNS